MAPSTGKHYKVKRMRCAYLFHQATWRPIRITKDMLQSVKEQIQEEGGYNLEQGYNFNLQSSAYMINDITCL